MLALVLLAMVGVGWWSNSRLADSDQPIGLFTTLPILWSDNPDLSAALSAEDHPHWARIELAKRGKIEPLDVLSAISLDRIRRLVIAQPRVLMPAENVALDAWVRGGGQLLLLADPALTEDSAFALSDPRRPQAVVLLSPILARWGLELRITDGQVLGEESRDVMGVAVPVNLPGHFVTQGQGNCKLWADGLAVTCKIGQGRVVALADATVLERDDPARTRAKAFRGLLDTAFAVR
jgi:hypothetical protein